MALRSKGNFQINGIEFSPKSFKPNYESLATNDSGRTDDGIMHITYVLDRVRKYEIEMPPCGSDLISQLFSLVQGKEYYMTFFDPLENAEMTRKFYTSNSAADCYSGVLYNGLWQGVAFNAIELGGEKNGQVIGG